ncbi:unnamed protein product [Ilex paraguariensis]|uniref:Uncharacterized protein n=1 Tax=Ilex paraguariensis TaxID=185542 RepID=A0ABC8UR31_9AQUA
MGVRWSDSAFLFLETGVSGAMYLAYEYARRGACLALVERREQRLRIVAECARELGAADVIAIRADVSNVDDCKLVVDETMNRYGCLFTVDHLVNNAGVNQVCMLEEVDDITDLRPVMDINFWGSVYTTQFAAPHLRNSKGKIIALSSSASWLPKPRMSLYNASKAAMAQFFETLRVEFAPDVKITLVTPGFIESELTQGKFLTEGGKVVVDQEMRDVSFSPSICCFSISYGSLSIMPVAAAEACAKAIVNSACRGDRYVTHPAWFSVTFLWKVFCPEVMDLFFRLLYNPRPGVSLEETLSKQILDLTGSQKVLYPGNIQTPEQKTD